MGHINGISIVICCYNAEERIGATLEHVQKQKFTVSFPWEVIVINNASTDNTMEVAYKQWEKNPVTAFKIVEEKKQGLNYARDRGFKEAAFEIVSLIDDDNWMEELWLEKVYHIFNQHPTVGACGGRTIAHWETEPPSWFKKFEKCYAVGEPFTSSGIVGKEGGNLFGAGLSIKKSIWKTLKDIGFEYLTADRKGNSLSSGGDTELCYAVRMLGYDLYYDKDLLIRHFIPKARLSLLYLERMNFELGRAYARLMGYFVLYHSEKKRPWHTDFSKALWLYNKIVLKNFFSSSPEIKLKNKIRSIWLKGYITQLWYDKFKRKKVYQQLNEVISKAKHKNPQIEADQINAIQPLGG